MAEIHGSYDSRINHTGWPALLNLFSIHPALSGVIFTVLLVFAISATIRYLNRPADPSLWHAFHTPIPRHVAGYGWTNKLQRRRINGRWEYAHRDMTPDEWGDLMS